ncbi:hypothetical protein U0070_025769 [Myodes glareolus]|uniref:Uncharacterized protein n=1 Tax=Myodes glareolus TaxID=447135 RepID=A0AAW0HEZ9_MYOGA
MVNKTHLTITTNHTSLVEESNRSSEKMLSSKVKCLLILEKAYMQKRQYMLSEQSQLWDERETHQSEKKT